MSRKNAPKRNQSQRQQRYAEAFDAWQGVVKPSRTNRQQKRGWKRGRK